MTEVISTRVTLWFRKNRGTVDAIFIVYGKYIQSTYISSISRPHSILYGEAAYG